MTIIAHGMAVTMCNDPKCGLHFVLYDTKGKELCTTMMDRETSLAMIKHMQGLLYHKTASNDRD